ncbi:MAG: BMP family ABC transporter substrate-binding protein [Candidatus Bipolaricaulaceae bacterium]
MHPGGYMLADNFGTYLLGVAAGLMTKTGKIGFLGGVPIAFVLGSCNAFHPGARAVDPKQGRDVIGSHLDSPIAVAQTAEAASAFFVGYPFAGSAEVLPQCLGHRARLDLGRLLRGDRPTGP